MKLVRLFIMLFCISFFFVPILAQRIESGYISVSGNAKLYYEKCGKGEPIVLLHGHSLDTRMWNMQFQAFAKHYQVIRFDFRGYGKSSPQTETFQFTHLDDFITVMDSLHIRRAHVVGLSMGAFVASEVLAIYPERLFSCILASGSLKTYKGPSEPMDEVEKNKRDMEIAALKEKGIEQMKREWLENLMNSGGSCKERMREPLQQMINDWSAWQPLHKEVRVLMAHDAEVVFKQRYPQVPTLMIEGNAPHNRFNTHPWMLDYLPRGEYYLLSDCGHMMNMEQPEAFNKVILRFIKKHAKGK